MIDRGYGMLWLDDSKAPLKDRVRNAARFFREKYGLSATHCLVPVSEAPKPIKIGRVFIEPSQAAPAKHLWLFRRKEA